MRKRKTTIGRAAKAAGDVVRAARAKRKGTKASTKKSSNLTAKEKASFKASYDKVPSAGGKKLTGFGQAFKEARKAGKSTFTYNGKKYTTEMAGDKKKPASKPAAKAPSVKVVLNPKLKVSPEKLKKYVASNRKK